MVYKNSDLNKKNKKQKKNKLKKFNEIQKKKLPSRRRPTNKIFFLTKLKIVVAYKIQKKMSIIKLNQTKLKKN